MNIARTYAYKITKKRKNINNHNKSFYEKILFSTDVSDFRDSLRFFAKLPHHQYR